MHNLEVKCVVSAREDINKLKNEVGLFDVEMLLTLLERMVICVRTILL